MTSITLGPLALPIAPLLLLAATMLAMRAARRFDVREASEANAARQSAADAVLQGLYVALVAARCAHVAIHAEAYSGSPWAAFDLRDGGWHLPSGLIAGLGWIAWRAWRRPPWRRAIAVGTTIGLTVWISGTIALLRMAPVGMPDVVLTDLATGAPVRLRETAPGRPLVLNLWATWCGPCRREMPVLADAQRAHPDVRFVFANQGESAEVVRRYLDAEGLSLSTVLLGTGSSLGDAVGSRGLPTTIFYDANGRRIDAHLGALNGAALAAKLRTAGVR